MLLVASAKLCYAAKLQPRHFSLVASAWSFAPLPQALNTHAAHHKTLISHFTTSIILFVSILYVNVYSRFDVKEQ